MSDIEKVDTAASSRLDVIQSRREGPPSMSRVYSAPHIDNQSAFYFDHDKSPDDARSDSEDSLGPSFTNQDGPNAREDPEQGALPIELQKSQTARSQRSQRSQRDPKLITWRGPDDPENPKNWPMRKRWAAVFVVSCFTFISPVSSSMVAPALTAIAKEFGIQNEVETQMTLSIFVLAYAIGPLFLGPLSEMFGRVIILQTANMWYLVWNIACGVAQSKGQLIAFRFLAGLGGSAPLAIGGGVMGDCFRPEERGRAIAVYSLAPLIGPAVGPIAGGFISENTTWRWIFYATSIVDGAIQVGGLFLLQETYAPTLLQKKAMKLRKETGDSSWHTEYDDPDRSIVKVLSTSFQRPFRLLATQPIVQVLALYMAYIYGLMYLMLASFPSLWTNPARYNESVGIGGLNYISLGIGFFFGAQFTALTNDWIYRRLSAKNKGVGRPEFRTPMLCVAALLMPIGLFIYGWTAQYTTHWIGPNIGACIFCAGTIVAFQCMQTYLVDAYTRFAASALAAAVVLRSLAGFGFPLFAPYMFAKLNFGWGNTLLAFVSIGIGFPAPILLWKYGERLRKMSPYAAGS